MKLTNEQLRQIIKEELKSVLEYFDSPEIPGEELPQGQELTRALGTKDPIDKKIAQLQASIDDMRHSREKGMGGDPWEYDKLIAADEAKIGELELLKKKKENFLKIIKILTSAALFLKKRLDGI